MAQIYTVMSDERCLLQQPQAPIGDGIQRSTRFWMDASEFVCFCHTCVAGHDTPLEVAEFALPDDREDFLRSSVYDAGSRDPNELPASRFWERDIESYDEEDSEDYE